MFFVLPFRDCGSACAPQEFLDELSDYCNALVARRQQCLALRARAELLALDASDAYDYVHARVRRYDVYAVFDDLRLDRPTRVEVFDAARPGDRPNAEPRERPDVAERVLAAGRLDDALLEIAD